MLRKTVQKGIWLSAGILFLVLAIIGLLLPIIPQMPFFIVATLCFIRCSPRFNAWLGRRHWFARLHAWAEHKHWFHRVKDHLPHPLHRKKHDSSSVD